MITPEEGEKEISKYINVISRTLEDLRRKGCLPQSTPIDFKVHALQPGDWVLIKTWKETPLQSKWEGPYQVLLTTETAIRTAEKGWSHHTRVKGPVPAPEEEERERNNQETPKLKEENEGWIRGKRLRKRD